MPVDPAVRRSRASLARQWAEDRKAFAGEWFQGDSRAADEFLNALPYSEIPDWEGATYVMEKLDNLGALAAPLPKEVI